MPRPGLHRRSRTVPDHEHARHIRRLAIPTIGGNGPVRLPGTIRPRSTRSATLRQRLHHRSGRCSPNLPPFLTALCSPRPSRRYPKIPIGLGSAQFNLGLLKCSLDNGRGLHHAHGLARPQQTSTDYAERRVMRSPSPLGRSIAADPAVSVSMIINGPTFWGASLLLLGRVRLAPRAWPPHDV
jgi:hypothetical protein